MKTVYTIPIYTLNLSVLVLDKNIALNYSVKKHKKTAIVGIYYIPMYNYKF